MLEVKMKKREYTFTEEEITDVLSYIVRKYSRKKFTEYDLKRIIDGKMKDELKDKNSAFNLQEIVKEGKKVNNERLDDYTKMELICKSMHKIWMYKIEGEKLDIKEGVINKKLKESIINFNDEDQLECYLNKQIILKKKRGYVYT